ncbi:hypothetical protein, partial [Sphingomonas sp.]|uniref:hypothetical protein n=1 Tax=Sphingomonas sp. TaxID=28214 RepID=UPI00286AD24B
MLDGMLRKSAFGLLASTALVGPAFAQSGVNDTAPAPTAAAAQDGTTPDSTEIIVTAQKREENLSRVPIS